MLQELRNNSDLGSHSLGFALKRRNDRFVVEPIGGIVNPAYEPDLSGDAASTGGANRGIGQSKWRV
ncbi:GL16979 [Drosophila persimilis]|uniref:GL16979 n=1 Tax=Drosophila persimilis TaxID=7234 RepID=B4GHA6_DROPE|nr:GL16979 [Drosophila persimilis]